MKRSLIIPATIALLTGMAATAQETNETNAEINASTAVNYTADSENLDELSIEELNALQLRQLKVSSEPAESEDTIFAVQEETAQTTDDAAIDTEVGGTLTADADLAVDTEMGVGGPDYASETEAMTDLAMQGTIADLASEDARFTTFVDLVAQAGLMEDLDGDTQYTVFAPTNAAFEKLDADLVAKLKSGEAHDRLVSILKAHIVEGETLSNELSNDMAEGETTIATLADMDLAIRKTGDTVMIGNAAIVSADIDASNGVIHAVDTVLVQADADLEPNGS